MYCQARLACIAAIGLLAACASETPIGPTTPAGDSPSATAPQFHSPQQPAAHATAAAQFDPLTDAALMLCLDDQSRFCKDTAGTQLCADGDSCAYWGDRSTNGYHAKAIAGVARPVYRGSALGGRAGLVWSGGARALTLGTPSALAALQSGNFTLLVAASYHAGGGWIVAKCAGASDGIFSIYVIDSMPGMYHSNKGIRVTPDEFFTMTVASDRSKTEVNGVKRFYQNGAPRNSNIGAVSVDNSQEIEIGSIPTGRQYYSWNGRIFAVFLFSRTLSAAEVWQADQVLRSRYSQTWQGSPSPMIVLWDGNSISANGEIARQVALSLGIPVDAVFNFAWGSKGTQHMNTYAASDIDALVPFLPAGQTVVSVGWELSNDFMYGATASAAYQHVRTYGLARKAAGMKHVVATGLPRDGVEDRRALANDSVRTFFQSFADGLADVASDPNMGQAGQNSNATYYGDGLHPNALGETTLVPYFVNAIRSAANTGSTGVLEP
jgi:hypothetical protein